MPSTRISEAARETIKGLAGKKGKTIQSTLEEAIEWYRRKCFLEECNTAFASMRADSKAWREEQEEREAWDTALADNQKEG
jgi:hypothetical protein